MQWGTETKEHITSRLARRKGDRVISETRNPALNGFKAEAGGTTARETSEAERSDALAISEVKSED